MICSTNEFQEPAALRKHILKVVYLWISLNKLWLSKEDAMYDRCSLTRATQQPIRKKMKRKPAEGRLCAAVKLTVEVRFHSFLFHSPLQHSTSTITTSRPGNWKRKADQSWSSYLCVHISVRLFCGYARPYACLLEIFIIQLLIPYSSQKAWSHISLSHS